MSASPYPIRVVLPEWLAGEEPMGTKRKFWCQAGDGLRYLFKYAREGTGEDWAEKVAAEIATVLGVPHATVDLATFKGHPGTLTLRFDELNDDHELVHGNELLQEDRPGYVADVRYRASQHTVEAVLQVLGQQFVHPPLQAPRLPGLATAVDWFVGYLLLDALIGNTDRHHENWGVIERAGSPERYVSLAPSYDHASSLGRELLDEERQARLEGEAGHRHTVASYAGRARSALYKSVMGKKPLSPINAFREAMAVAPEAGRAWLTRLETIDDATLSGIVNRVPSSCASELARRFAAELLAVNRRELLMARETAK